MEVAIVAAASKRKRRILDSTLGTSRQCSSPWARLYATTSQAAVDPKRRRGGTHSYLYTRPGWDSAAFSAIEVLFAFKISASRSYLATLSSSAQTVQSTSQRGSKADGHSLYNATRDVSSKHVFVRRTIFNVLTLSNTPKGQRFCANRVSSFVEIHAIPDFSVYGPTVTQQTNNAFSTK